MAEKLSSAPPPQTLAQAPASSILIQNRFLLVGAQNLPSLRHDGRLHLALHRAAACRCRARRLNSREMELLSDSKLEELQFLAARLRSSLTASAVLAAFPSYLPRRPGSSILSRQGRAWLCDRLWKDMLFKLSHYTIHFLKNG
ncbi:hypothetical protein ACQ4PT_047408 [Festuca glaucescens]